MAGPAATGSVVAHSEKPIRVCFCAFKVPRADGRGLIIAFLPRSAARRTES